MHPVAGEGKCRKTPLERCAHGAIGGKASPYRESRYCKWDVRHIQHVGHTYCDFPICKEGEKDNKSSGGEEGGACDGCSGCAMPDVCDTRDGSTEEQCGDEGDHTTWCPADSDDEKCSICEGDAGCFHPAGCVEINEDWSAKNCQDHGGKDCSNNEGGNDRSGEEVCEEKGHDKETCESFGCCAFNEDKCWSAVGDKACSSAGGGRRHLIAASGGDGSDRRRQLSEDSDHNDEAGGDGDDKQKVGKGDFAPLPPNPHCTGSLADARRPPAFPSRTAAVPMYVSPG